MSRNTRPRDPPPPRLRARRTADPRKSRASLPRAQHAGRGARLRTRTHGLDARIGRTNRAGASSLAKLERKTRSPGVAGSRRRGWRATITTVMADPARRRATYEDLAAVPAPLIAEILDGELVTQPRPAARHALVASGLAGEVWGPFHSGRGGPGGW